MHSFSLLSLSAPTLPRVLQNSQSRLWLQTSVGEELLEREPCIRMERSGTTLVCFLKNMTQPSKLGLCVKSSPDHRIMAAFKWQPTQNASTKYVWGFCSSTAVVCTVLLGMLLCYRAGFIGPQRPDEHPGKGWQGEQGRGEKIQQVSSSFSLLFSVLEPSFLSSRRGGGHELCMGRVWAVPGAHSHSA